MAEHKHEIDVKKKSSLPKVYEEFNDLLNQINLADLDSSSPDAAQVIINARAIDLKDAMNSHSKERCVVDDELVAMATAITSYNFAWTFQELFPEMFADAEKEMARISKHHRWAARGSWNAFVDRSNVAPKKQNDVSFLDKFHTNHVNAQ